MGYARSEKEWIVLDRLADIILENVDGCVIDIGMGKSTYVLARHAKKFNRIQYSCEVQQKIIDKFCPDGKLHDNHIIYNGYSWDLMKDFDKKIAIVFMDGSHFYDTVKKEIEDFLTKLSDYGMVFVHDTFPPSENHVFEKEKRCGNVYKVRKYFEKVNPGFTFTWPYKLQAQNCGLTMIMKKKEGEPYYRE